MICDVSSACDGAVLQSLRRAAVARECAVKFRTDPHLWSKLTRDALGVHAAVILSFCVAMMVSCQQSRGMIRQHRMLMCGGGALSLVAALLFVFRHKVKQSLSASGTAPPNPCSEQCRAAAACANLAEHSNADESAHW